MSKQGCVMMTASLAASLAASLGACGFDSTPMGSAVCVEGQSADRACEDGSRGLHSCSEGEFGACVCGPGDGSDTGTAPPHDASGSGSSANGSGNEGSSGEGGSEGASGDGGGTAGSAPGPSAGAGSVAGSGAPQPGGEGGATGLAGSGGKAGGAGSDGGAGGAGGRAGGGGGDPVPAPPGTAYAFCATQTDCKNGLVCTVSLDAAASGYCAPFCMFNGGGGNAGGAGGCEQPKSGEVQAQCAPLVGLCLLTACQNKDCPARMECVQTTLPFGQQDVASNCRYLTK